MQSRGHLLQLVAAAAAVPLALFLPPAPADGAGSPVVHHSAAGATLPIEPPAVVTGPERVEPVPVLAMPGQSIDIEALTRVAPGAVRASATSGRIRQDDRGGWAWEAPTAPGVYDLSFLDTRTGSSTRRAAIVMRPYQGEATLNGYRIGAYQARPLRGNPAYERPKGLIEVTADNRDMPISPHFTLGQFLCKQESGYPKYVLVQPVLVSALERLVSRLDERGLDPRALRVMSAYRTPAYNAAIGNTTVYSRHAYGDAADVYVDADGNGRMDDLDGDGRESIRDAEWLYDVIEELADEPHELPLVGGLGLYGPKPHRGPFVHLDARGHVARW